MFDKTTVFLNNDKISEYRKINKIKINSLCTALFLSIHFFNYYLNINTLLLSSLVLLISLLNNNYITINTKALCFFAYNCLIFGISYIILGNNTVTFTYFSFFLFFCFTSVYLCDKEYDIKNVIHYSSIIHTLFSPIVLFTSIVNGATMGETYAVLFGTFSIFISVFNKDFKPKTLWRFIFPFSLFIYVYKISLVSTRGVFLAVAVFLILYYIVSITNKSISTYVLLGMAILVSILFYTYMYEIFVAINKLLGNFNISLNVINKSIKLLELEKFDHNRNILYDYAIESIKNHLLFGQGIGSFEIQTGKIYIHNFILQFLFEGGLFYAVPYLFILIKFISWITPTSDEQKVYQLFIILLSSSTLVKLFFSEVFYRDPKFWFLIMLLITVKKEKKHTMI